MADPNFPDNMAIRPSIRPQPFGLGDLPSETSFGLSAQKDGINKYGIAGRVWCASVHL
jgi:hypothetical protein